MNVQPNPQTALHTKAPAAEVTTFTNLLPIQEKYYQGVTTHSVNARDLHAFLEVKSRFDDWFRNRVNDELCDFQENRDYWIILNCSNFAPKKIGAKNNQSSKGKAKTRGGHNQVNYHISLNMAKELAMLERNQQGKLARQYFINCETALNELSPQTAERLRLDWQEQRQAVKAPFKAMCAALEACLLRNGKQSQRYHYSNESRMISGIVCGMSVNQYCEKYGITGDIREKLTADQLAQVDYLEQANEMLLNADVFDFKERQQKLIIAFSNRFRRC